MGALLGVAAGSSQPPKLIVLKAATATRSIQQNGHRPSSARGSPSRLAPGISIKPAAQRMWDDEGAKHCSGAASVIG